MDKQMDTERNVLWIQARCQEQRNRIRGYENPCFRRFGRPIKRGSVMDFHSMPD